ncbi:MAG: hypothetical protein ABI721_01285 [Candidatus Dojkabacteria bacterium]
MQNSFSLRGVFKTWAVIAITVILLTGLVYIVGQQILRNLANDPQIQTAEDLVVKLNAGQDPTTLLVSNKVDMNKSLSTFGIIYDDQYNIVYSTGFLNDTAPVPPDGVFEAAKQNGVNILTWQPGINIRDAIVVQRYDTGYILVGRSLREVEKRANNLLLLSIAGGLITLASTFVLTLSIKYFENSRSKVSYSNPVAATPIVPVAQVVPITPPVLPTPIVPAV